MANLIFSLIALVILIFIFIIIRYINIFRAKKYVNFLDDDTFKKGMRKAQVIDVREKNPFNNGHILGARNIAYSTFKTFYKEIRPDLPVYLYDQNKTLSLRAAKFLNKKGFTDISILNNGYQKWDGKIKKS